MDRDHFDALVQRLASTRLTRGGALRGLVAGIAAASGVAGASAFSEARAKKRHHKKEICHCANPAATCSTETVGKKQRKRHLKQDQCDYLGPCQGTLNPCAGAGSPITIDLSLLGLSCTAGGTECGDSAVSGLTCLLGLCVPLDVANGVVCASDADCSTGRCTGAVCADCPTASICGADDSAQCCVAEADCIRGLCVLPVAG
jgi:hypothetical protein